MKDLFYEKIFLFDWFFLLISLTSSNAQIKLIFNGGARIPTGDFSNVADVGFGGSATAEFKIPLSPLAIAFSTGYDRFGITTGSFDTYAIPIMGGFKYFISTPGNLVAFYFGALAGVSILDSTAPNSISESKFIWSPTVGARIINIDINVNYKSISSNGITISWFGFNVGYIL